MKPGPKLEIRPEDEREEKILGVFFIFNGTVGVSGEVVKGEDSKERKSERDSGRWEPDGVNFVWEGSRDGQGENFFSVFLERGSRFWRIGKERERAGVCEWSQFPGSEKWRGIKRWFRIEGEREV
ncbi:hypothetical protein COLO4_20590 [Corchorus olitorius]|uniref:Uncharacterized protein n=1 Tax=Corchorus olitorius TaxID=93759 RepID=A0A1R3IYV6_9ROSI|nr:hypothetical protein COLO4_20590 [Corchorus olitorius]